MSASLTTGLASGSGSDTLIGIENLTGTANADRLTGDANANALDGAGGNDTLNGGQGNDWLIGGPGGDYFVFDTLPNASGNVDRIVDFNVADDTLQLENALFTSLLTPGPLAAGSFRAGSVATAANDADDFLLYDTSSGALYYDQLGSGGAAAQQIAWLTPGLTLTALDFMVI